MTALRDLPVDPAVSRWIGRVTELSETLPDLESADPERRRTAQRRLSDSIAVDFTLPVPDGVDIEDFTLATSASAIRVRRYRPASAPDRAPSQLWLHGGGFTGGAVDEMLADRLCAALALASGVQLLALDYRLAPEHPYPAQVEDTIAALAALRDGADRLGIDAQRLGLGGNSAGAAIAVSTALRLQDTAAPPLLYLDLEVPVAAMRPIGPSADEYATGFGLDDFDGLIALYLGQDGAADAYASAIDAPRFDRMPPTRIAVARYDPLRDGGILLTERLRAANVPVVLDIGDGQLHSSLGLTAQMPGAREWQARHAEELATAYRTTN
ncbi:alpha/beta hydrolase [Curtobacterium sp. 18060]|uniref:alpha/beta hydrolase n=1 Tax=Curtobacterium sp. 18060 TaxID=2681408 RepID=UPI00135C43A3|nr:alpha/beta hydrolase [Curtobacterium sp. 18060]